MILAAANGSDVGRDTSIDNDVVFSRMVSYWKAPEDLEAITVVDLVRNVSEILTEVG